MKQMNRSFLSPINKKYVFKRVAEREGKVKDGLLLFVHHISVISNNLVQFSFCKIFRTENPHTYKLNPCDPKLKSRKSGVRTKKKDNLKLTSIECN